jgi:hypothetical protein
MRVDVPMTTITEMVRLFGGMCAQCAGGITTGQMNAEEMNNQKNRTF